MEKQKEEIKKVLNAHTEEWIKLETIDFLLEVKIDKSSSDGLFCWTGRSTYNSWIFPVSNWNTVIHFKTEKGAKRNFLKKYYPKELIIQTIKKLK